MKLENAYDLKGGDNGVDPATADSHPTTAQELELNRFVSKKTAATGKVKCYEKIKVKINFLGFVSTGLLASNADQVDKTINKILLNLTF